jgi:hypothetical protein
VSVEISIHFHSLLKTKPATESYPVAGKKHLWACLGQHACDQTVSQN